MIEAGSSAGLSNLATVHTGSPATSFGASGIGAGTYFVRVRAVNGAGTSLSSNETNFTVGGGVGGTGGACAPGAPAGLTASVDKAMAAVTMTWSAASGTPTSYIVEAGSTPGSTSLGSIDVGLKTTYTVSAPPGVYYARVRARNNCGIGAASNEASFVISPPDVLWDVIFNNAIPPGIDMSVCHSGVTWTSQNIRVDSSGAFHEFWSPMQPNMARVDGTLTPTTFSGTLACTNGAASGTMSGTWDGSAFVGSVSFNGQTRSLRVTLHSGQ